MTQGRKKTNYVVPLCFTHTSRIGPYRVLTHPCDVTVATGIAYAEKILQRTANEVNSHPADLRLSPPDGSLIISMDDTNLRSNAFKI